MCILFHETFFFFDTQTVLKTFFGKFERLTQKGFDTLCTQHICVCITTETPALCYCSTEFKRIIYNVLGGTSKGVV